LVVTARLDSFDPQPWRADLLPRTDDEPASCLQELLPRPGKWKSPILRPDRVRFGGNALHPMPALDAQLARHSAVGDRRGIVRLSYRRRAGRDQRAQGCVNGVPASKRALAGSPEPPQLFDWTGVDPVGVTQGQV
jgi:hypothetical protein